MEAAAIMFSNLIIGLFLFGVLYLGFLFLRPAIKRDEYNQAYYIARLKQHAMSKKIDLDAEIKVFFRTPKMILKEEYKTDIESSAVQTDQIIEELNKKGK